MNCINPVTNRIMIWGTVEPAGLDLKSCHCRSDSWCSCCFLIQKAGCISFSFMQVSACQFGQLTLSLLGVPQLGHS